jgi:hypothetical protein
MDMAFLVRQSLLRDFLEDNTRRKRYFSRVRDVFLDDSTQDRGNTSILLVTPGMGDLDLQQLAFETTVLVDDVYRQRWLDWLNSPVCLATARNLEENLGWLMEQEAWSLVRRSALLSVGGFTPEMEKDGTEAEWANVSAVGLRFGALHRLRLAMANFESQLNGVRLILPQMRGCRLIGARWVGVHLHHPSFIGLDAVNARMPGLVVRGGQWVDVDGRGCDLRGAVFYNCRFSRLNLRDANLREVDFIGCSGRDIDLRGADLQEIGFHNCAFENVMYFKADDDKFK